MQRALPIARFTAALACVAALSACSRAGAPSAQSASTAPAVAAAPSAAVQTTPAAAAGLDLVDDARLLYRVLACSGDAPLPANLDAATVKAHCAQMQPRMQGYREHYLKQAAPFLEKLRPKDAPTTVVYPFGGGDLLTALTTYPEATDITTLSLEQSGDPRRLNGLDQKRLADSLQLIRSTMAPLLSLNDSTSANLMKGQRGEIPGQLGFFIVGLAVHGYEPVSVRYFRIEDGGALHYYTREEVEAGDKRVAKSLKGSWTAPDFAPMFANVEIGFRRAGAASSEPLRVHRHIGANLADDELAKTPGLLRYLEAKGQVSAMTKAASYLLWRNDFASVRQYLLSHMVFMVSDSTGIPPAIASKAGFTQETYGRFTKSFLGADKAINEQFRELWHSQPSRPLPFRYGYIDGASQYHLMVTRKEPAAKS